MARPPTSQAEAFARLAHEETGYGVVADKVQKNLFASEKVYRFIRPMKTVGVIPRHRGSQGHRDRRAVRRRRRHRAVDESDVNGDLQDPDLAQGALPDRHQPASGGGAVHHARRGSDERGRPAGGRARRCDQLDVDGDARRHAGTDEGARDGRHPGDRRDGAGARRVQRRQAGLRRRSGQRARATSSDRPMSRRPCATSSPARRSTTACSARPRTRSSSMRRSSKRSSGSSSPTARTFMSPAEIDAVGTRARQPAAAAESGARRTAGDLHRPAGRHHRSADDARAHRRARRRRTRLSRCRSRSSAPSSRFTWSATGARAANAASRSCATAAWATPCPSTRGTRRSFCSSA